MIDEARLRKIEANANDIVAYGFVEEAWNLLHDDLPPVCSALREAWRMIRTLDIPLEMVANTPVPDNPGTVGEVLRRASEGKRDGQEATA